MKHIVESLVRFGLLSLIIGVAVGASAHFFFNWTPLTHHTFASCWDFIFNWRTFALTFLGLGIALFLRQVIIVLTRKIWYPAKRPTSLPPYLSMPLARSSDPCLLPIELPILWRSRNRYRSRRQFLYLALPAPIASNVTSNAINWHLFSQSITSNTKCVRVGFSYNIG